MSTPLQIFAAGSLRPAFDPLLAARDAVVSYANARDLAERLSAGEPADVFASASADHPAMLHRAGLVDAPRAFAANHLVVAVPRSSRARTVDVIAARGTRLVIEVAGIPLGDYTRSLLALLDRDAGGGFCERALANIAFEEQLVDAVAARLIDGEADAAVLYSTDVAARARELRAIEPPAYARVSATYVACVTTSTAQRERAAALVEELSSPSADAVLRAAGFEPMA